MQVLNAFFRLIRAGNLLIIALGLSLFYYLILVPVHHARLHTNLVPFITSDFVLFVLSVIYVAAAGNIINDYMDFELDKEFKPQRPLPQGLVSLNAAVYLHAIFAFAGIALGFYLGFQVSNYKIGYIYVISVIVLYGYSAFLKKIALVGNIVIALLAAFVFVLPLIFEATYLNAIHAGNLFETTGYAFNILLWQMKFYAGFAFLTSLAREIVKDMEDKEGDDAFGIHTLVVDYGYTVAKTAAALVLLTLFAALGYFIKGFIEVHATVEIIYLSFVLELPVLGALLMLLRAKEQKDYRRLSNLLKIIMLLGILSIAVFYLFNRL
jgi:4-hydroxybenzoate polyprenyltransferase